MKKFNPTVGKFGILMPLYFYLYLHLYFDSFVVHPTTHSGMSTTLATPFYSLSL